jgi:hypothetical protein
MTSVEWRVYVVFVSSGRYCGQLKVSISTALPRKYFIQSSLSLTVIWSQFHQHFTSTFLYKILAPKTTKLAFGFEILAPKISYEKRACTTFMKLTPGVNFTKILWAAFTHRSQKRKKYSQTVNLFCAFAYFGICAHKSCELNIEVNFTSILQAVFTGEGPKSQKRQSSHQCVFALLGSARIKAARKTLVKSTPDHCWSTILISQKFN